jgi:hypothetical protein
LYGMRQSVAVWCSFAIGCLLVPLLDRPPEPPVSPPVRVDGIVHTRPSVEGIPLLDTSPIESDVVAAATRWGLDPALVLAVVEAESCKMPNAVSPRGAVGLMQVLPETAFEVGIPDSADPADPAQNLEAGCHYLASLLESFGGDVELALAAYNAGPGAVRTWGTVPPYRETKEFINRVNANYEQLTGMDLEGATQFTADSSSLL